MTSEKTFNNIMKTQTEKYKEFVYKASPDIDENIMRMHTIYKLPYNIAPTIDEKFIGENPAVRIEKFTRTILEEIEEGKEVVDLMKKGLTKDAIVALTDWLCDIIVYARSEGAKFGIPIDESLRVIMASNFTKAGDVPKYDENGKFKKNLETFIPPEQMLGVLLNVEDGKTQEEKEIDCLSKNFQFFLQSVSKKEEDECLFLIKNYGTLNIKEMHCLMKAVKHHAKCVTYLESRILHGLKSE